MMLTVQKVLFNTYMGMLELISRTGLARRLLPLPWRISIGSYLTRMVNIATHLDTSRPYQVMGYRMWVYPGDLTRKDIIFGAYERATVEVFKKSIQPGMTVVDIGAFVGFYTLLAASLVGPKGKVYAFEPNPHAFEILLRNVQENGYEECVEIIPKAISNRKAQLRLFINDRVPAESSFYKREGYSVEVESIPLDEFFAGRGWPEVHFIKVDVEGAEVEVLEGMKETVRRNPWVKLIVEFNPGVQQQAIGSYEKFFEVLLQLEFDWFYAIHLGVKSISIPQDIPMVVRLTETTRYVNLFCEKKER